MGRWKGTDSEKHLSFLPTLSFLPSVHLVCLTLAEFTIPPSTSFNLPSQELPLDPQGRLLLPILPKNHCSGSASLSRGGFLLEEVMSKNNYILA